MQEEDGAACQSIVRSSVSCISRIQVLWLCEPDGDSAELLGAVPKAAPAQNDQSIVTMQLNKNAITTTSRPMLYLPKNRLARGSGGEGLGLADGTSMNTWKTSAVNINKMQGTSAVAHLNPQEFDRLKVHE